jgi:O-methyltransferase
VLGVGYPEEQIHFVEGPVEETVPGSAPAELALLRLDTDWYESTKHELEHLYPRLARGGVLILDDYGYWQGARRAVDEYLAGLDSPLLLNRIDHTARIALKP